MNELLERPHQTDEASAADNLQMRIAALVRKLNELDEVVPNLNRRLCRLARENAILPEDFRSRLVQAGLEPSRASELKVVLLAEAECTAFLGDDGQEKRQSWKETLAQARLEYLRVTFGLSAEDLLAARVAGSIARLKLTRLSLGGGILTIELRTEGIESLIPISLLS